ncbi:MAG TPA: site-2 protease family protein [Longimicrobiales bacterium]|nr:site-2 protease family protein [Longimicrobiales bacterium]
MGGLRLGSIMGIDVRVHSSWIVIAALVMWSLSSAALPADFADVSPAGRLGMAAVITLLFFVSLLAHELAHSVVAVVRGIPVRSITFFLFGGMAETTKDSRSPGEEFLIAIAGPLCSFLLAALFFWLWLTATRAGWPRPVAGTAAYTAVLNAILGVFNLLPGFPMDGGRVLRAAIWKATGNVTQATRWAARVGEWMAYGLMLWGGWDALTGNFMGGLWLVLIALFIRNAARMGYRQHLLGRLQETAREWAVAPQPGPPSGPPELTGRDVTDLRPGKP